MATGRPDFSSPAVGLLPTLMRIRVCVCVCACVCVRACIRSINAWVSNQQFQWRFHNWSSTAVPVWQQGLLLVRSWSPTPCQLVSLVHAHVYCRLCGFFSFHFYRVLSIVKYDTCDCLSSAHVIPSLFTSLTKSNTWSSDDAGNQHAVVFDLCDRRQMLRAVADFDHEQSCAQSRRIACAVALLIFESLMKAVPVLPMVLVYMQLEFHWLSISQMQAGMIYTHPVFRRQGYTNLHKSWSKWSVPSQSIYPALQTHMVPSTNHAQNPARAPH